MQIFGDIEIENCEFETRRIFILDCEKISADLNCSIVELAVIHHHSRKGCRSMKLYFIDELSNYFNRICLKHFTLKIKERPIFQNASIISRQDECSGENKTIPYVLVHIAAFKITVHFCGVRTKYTSF